MSSSKVQHFQLRLLTSSSPRQSSMRHALLLQLILVVLAVPQDGSPHCRCNALNCPEANCTQKGIDPCTCCPVCLKGEGERCGGHSDAEGFCGQGLHCALRHGSVFGWEKAGVCEQAFCRHFLPRCGFRQRCVYDWSTRRFKCGCPQFKCAGKFNPVCGHDNMEYTSICRLQEKECKTGEFIGIKNFSACEREEEKTDDPIDLNDIVTVPTNGGCVHENNWYTIGQKVESNKEDPCQVIYCTAPGTLKVVSFPGCGVNPPEEDYGVDKPPVDGGWGPWSPWSQCVGRCGSALRRRERNCTNPVPANEGRPCNSSGVEEEECTPKSCEESAICVDYISGWSYWSPCSATCGQGTRKRVRRYKHAFFQLSAPERRRVFDLCPDMQEESCSVSKCSNENCSSTFVYDYIWRKHPDLQLNITINRLEQNCRSIQKYSFMVCGGMCSSSSASVKTACCQPSNIRTKSVTFQCHPDVRRQREISIQFPHSCTCVPCNR